VLLPCATLCDCAWFQRLKLNYDVPLSSFAFDCNLRRYNLEVAMQQQSELLSAGPEWGRGVMPDHSGHQPGAALQKLLDTPRKSSQLLASPGTGPTDDAATCGPSSPVALIMPPRGPRASTGSADLGEAVQVEPIKPTMKAPGTKHLNVQYDKLLSNFAFKFSLRRYISAK